MKLNTASEMRWSPARFALGLLIISTLLDHLSSNNNTCGKIRGQRSLLRCQNGQRLRGGRQSSLEFLSPMMPDLVSDSEILDEYIDRNLPYPANVRQQKQWAKRDKELKHKAWTDALLFDGRDDLLPTELPYGDKAKDDGIDPYIDDPANEVSDDPPPEPGFWKKAGKNKTYWGLSTRRIRELDEYVEEIRDPKLSLDFLPIDKYREAKGNLIAAIKSQDISQLKEAIENGIRFNGLSGYITEAEVLLHQLRTRDDYMKFKMRKGFLRERTLTVHIEDRKSLVEAKMIGCLELTITSPEPQYQIVQMSNGSPNFERWLELDGCERSGDGLYNVVLANNTANRKTGLAGKMLSRIKKEYVRKKPIKLNPEIFKIETLKRLRIRSKGHIVQIPREIENLKQLRELDLSGNGIRELPKEILKLEKLKILDIGFNDLLDMPSPFSNLRNLESIHAPGNKFRTMSFFNSLPKLKYCNVDHNKIGPELGISSLPNLEVLSFANNEVGEMPRLYEFPHLRVLNASYNRLRKLHPSLARLDPIKIREIYLTGNKLPDQRRVERLLSASSHYTRVHPAEGNFVMSEGGFYARFPERDHDDNRGERSLIWYMNKKATKKLHRARSKYILEFKKDELKDFIDNIAASENLDLKKDSSDVRCIHIACAFDEFKLVEALITQGADAEIRDKLGNTPLHYAYAYGNQKCIEVLNSAEVDQSARNRFNLTPSDMAKLKDKGFLIAENTETEEEQELEPPKNEMGNYLTGLPEGFEYNTKAAIGRILGVPPVPLENPSITERLCNISHTIMTPLPISRPRPCSISDVADPGVGPLWDWVSDQLHYLLNLEVEENPTFKSWTKTYLRHLKRLIQEGRFDEIRKDWEPPSAMDVNTHLEPTAYELLMNDGPNPDKFHKFYRVGTGV
mmetsp:Transcript_25423/g.61236  ORF Transcript_25423/g.61236 Transcript_25423/m.61236 type:complete len:908 (-) Transcript_25423:332-3055(-)|eukprot:CAMPEP_0114513546 /NCGR_PEP_ID=MMETSP0109-20121206/15638_1 /TAXON_ID=29199 /ORGANISM="Chlorarachnion reptans, Strain CCCM449" /LENGTH=907 /DNA_ID=CAMNT_0001693447 /DNA_START=153 /DNA_END=2876 /DNA_ORIENTATION=-